MYSRKKHFVQRLREFQGKESDIIPQHVIDQVIGQLGINLGSRASDCTIEDIAKSLHDLHLYGRFHRNRTKIWRIITEREPPLTEVEEMQCKAYFDMFLKSLGPSQRSLGPYDMYVQEAVQYVRRSMIQLRSDQNEEEKSLATEKTESSERCQ